MYMTAGEGSKLAGRLAFATEYVVVSGAFPFGRAALQPLFERAALEAGHSIWIERPLRLALEFFAQILKTGLPARAFDPGASALPTVQVWADAMWEPSQEEPARLAFVVRGSTDP